MPPPGSHLRPDLELTDARVITRDPARPRAEGLLIGRDKILALTGPGQPPTEAAGEVRRIDCGGRTVLPGFIDPHFHLLSYIRSLIDLNLEPSDDLRSLADLAAAVARAAEGLPPGAWVIGQGYDEFYLAEGRHPTRADLDRAAPGHPVKLTHRSRHAHVLNSRALALIGLTRETPDPPGGLIDRELTDGEPTGLLFGLGDFLAQRLPRMEPSDFERGLARADEALLSLGLTCLGEATFLNDADRWRTIGAWIEAGQWHGRVNLMLGWPGFQELVLDRSSPPRSTDRLGLGGVKIILERISGRLYPPPDELEAMIGAIHRAGWWAAVHAVEEPAIEAACGAIERVLAAHPVPAHGHRLEHCAQCPPGLARRLAAAGIAVVTQPAFIHRHGERYLATIPPDRQKYLYPLNILLTEGVTLAGSSDAPLSPPSPLLGIKAAIDRRTREGRRVGADQGLDLDQALDLYTRRAARVMGQGSSLGSLEPGKLADVVILDGDLTSVAVESLAEIKVWKTIVGGRVVWEA